MTYAFIFSLKSKYDLLIYIKQLELCSKDIIHINVLEISHHRFTSWIFGYISRTKEELHCMFYRG